MSLPETWRSVRLSEICQINPVFEPQEKPNQEQSVTFLPEGNFSDEKDANDADHLLPKTIYPCLSIHWANLFRACMGCNERYKLASDPIDPHGPGELNSIYHPFYAPAHPGIHIRIEQHPGDSNNYKISLNDSNHPQRTVNLDRILNLSKRWTERIKRTLEMDKSSLAAYVIESLGRRNQPFTEEAIKEELEYQSDSRKRKIGRKANMLLEVSIFDYQSKSPEEIFAIGNLHL